MSDEHCEKHMQDTRHMRLMAVSPFLIALDAIALFYYIDYMGAPARGNLPSRTTWIGLLIRDIIHEQLFCKYTDIEHVVV